MSFFDWIPTVGEVVDFIDCRLSGHNWKDGTCTQCGKKQK